jgi:hypothetical protein
MLVAALAPIQTSQPASAGLPPKLQSYLTTVVKATSGDRERLQTGAPVTKLLDTDGSKEIAVFGAIWIDAAIARYVEAVQDIESFERGGGFLVTRRISTPPRLEDFADLRLPEEDVEDLRTCTVGDCEVKLDQQALERFRSEIDWEAGDAQESADAVMRQLALDYVTGYLEGGNERLAVYRDSSRPTFVAEEFRAMVDRMPELAVYLPDMRHYLLEFPKITIPDSTSFLYWQQVEFGLKPTLRISHMTIRRGSDETVVASKMLYASHYFWTGLELRVLVPDPARGDGFWFVTVSRSRTGGLGGLKGLFVRRRVRSEVRNGTLAVLSATKQKLEQGR